MSVHTKRSYVHQAFEQGYVCVFPTEVAARSYLLDYALHSKKGAILKERAISFDTFRSYFLSRHETLRPSNELIRRLFIHQLLGEGASLTCLLNPAYPEANTRFATYLARLLPSLSAACDEQILSELDPELAHDLVLLYQRYAQFLATHQLFEPRYEAVHELPASEVGKQYCILFCDTISEATTLYEQLGRPSYLTLSPSPEPSDPATLTVHANHIQEIRSVIRSVHALLEQGVRAHSIIIGCASMDTLLGTLSEEARRYDVPLSVREGKSALSYPSGRFLSLLQEVYDQQFSLESLKSLLLDPSIPFGDRDTLHRFLARAVDKSIVKGSYELRDQYTEMLGQRELVSWYKDFKRSITSLVTARGIEEFRRKLNHFQDTYFVAEQWHGSADEEVYSFCLDTMQQVKSAMESCGLDSYPNIFSLLLSYLETRTYVRQQHETGIPVYAWPQVAPLIGEHLFILGLDQESSVCQDAPLSFLPEYVDPALVQGVDTTLANLKTACLGPASVHLSCHTKSYEGEALPPAYFFEHDALQAGNVDLSLDPYQEELLLHAGKPTASVKVTRSQQQWFAQALSTSLALRSDDTARHPVQSALVGRLYKEEEDGRYLSLSPTKLDLFLRCPYAFQCRHLLGIEEKNYDVQVVDHRQIGTLLHEVYQRFFSEIVFFDPGKMEEYESRLLFHFDQCLVDHYSLNGPTPSLRSYLVATYREQILAILAEEARLFADTRSIGFEQALTLKEDGLELYGRIDRIISLGDEDEKRYAVIDYKKSTVKAKRVTEDLASYQLPLYRHLVERVMGGKTANASYYSIAEGKYYSLWEHEDDEKALFCDDALAERLERIKDAVARGLLMATPSKKSCEGCAYRSLCRRRFATA